MKRKLFWIAIGQFIGAISFSQILNANNLVATGLGGLATVINRLIGWDVQILLIIMALPIFIWRGVTFIQGMDTTNVKKKMLLQTIVNQQELIALKDYIRVYQDDSIVYATRTTNILGRGFDVE